VELSNSIAELRSSIAELSNSIAGLSSSIAGLSSSITELSSSITELSSSITELSSSITELSNFYPCLRTSITGKNGSRRFKNPKKSAKTAKTTRFWTGTAPRRLPMIKRRQFGGMTTPGMAGRVLGPAGASKFLLRAFAPSLLSFIPCPLNKKINRRPRSRTPSARPSTTARK
jgi:hypothetical protein